MQCGITILNHLLAMFSGSAFFQCTIKYLYNGLVQITYVGTMQTRPLLKLNAIAVYVPQIGRTLNGIVHQ